MANIRRIHTLGYIGIQKDSLNEFSPPPKKEKNNIPKNPVLPPKKNTSNKLPVVPKIVNQNKQ